MQENNKVQLVYFPNRGNAQPIRILLMALGVDYEDVFVPVKTGIPSQYVEKYGLQMNRLPYLIHGDHIIFETLPIMKYCCLRFNRPDLLGVTIEDGVRIVEVIMKHRIEKNRLSSTLMAGIRQIMAKNLGQQGAQEIRKNNYSVSLQNKFLQASIKFFIKNKGYLLGYPTVLDFIFYDTCFNCSHLAEIEN